MINGCDVSHVNGKNINFNQMRAAGAEFVYIKATDFDLADGVDPCFYQNMVRAKGAGLAIGAYHRWRPDSKYGVQEQCALFYSVAGGLFDLPPAIEANEGGNPKSLWTARMFGMLTRTEEYFGRRPIIFTPYDIWRLHCNNNEWPSRYPIWIVYYKGGDTPKLPTMWKTWNLWRYSATGSAVQYGLDPKETRYANLDLFNGSLEELKGM